MKGAELWGPSANEPDARPFFPNISKLLPNRYKCEPRLDALLEGAHDWVRIV